VESQRKGYTDKCLARRVVAYRFHHVMAGAALLSSSSRSRVDEHCPWRMSWKLRTRILRGTAIPRHTGHPSAVLCWLSGVLRTRHGVP
jgi:hypothetical protein